MAVDKFSRKAWGAGIGRPYIGPPGVLMAEADIPDRFLPALRVLVNNLVWILPLVVIEQLAEGKMRGAIVLAIVAIGDFIIAVKWGLLAEIGGKGGRMSGAQLVLFVGIIGTWIFLTTCLGAGAWMLWTAGEGQPVQTSAPQPQTPDPGPIAWNPGFSIEGPLDVRVFSLRFSGANISKTQALQLKEANIISGIDGTLLPLQIVAVDAEGNNQFVPISKIQLIPPGARIELVAKFGNPDPKVPGHVLGVDPKTFLEKWRQFSFNVTDDVRSYHFDYDDRSMMVFFQGKVGPRVTIKPDPN